MTQEWRSRRKLQMCGPKADSIQKWREIDPSLVDLAREDGFRVRDTKARGLQVHASLSELRSLRVTLSAKTYY